MVPATRTLRSLPVPLLLAASLAASGCSTEATAEADGLPALVAAPADLPEDVTLVADNEEGDPLLDRFHMAANPGPADEDQFWGGTGILPRTAHGALYWGTVDLQSYLFTFALEFATERDAERWIESGDFCRPHQAMALKLGTRVATVALEPSGQGGWGRAVAYPVYETLSPDAPWVSYPPTSKAPDGPEDASAGWVESTAASIAQRTGAEQVCLRPGFTADDGNGDRGSATPLGPGLHGPFSISPRSDQDWYRIQADQRVYFRVEARSSGAVPELRIESESGGWVDLRCCDDPMGRARWGFLDPGTYYLVATAYERIPDYSLLVTVEDPSERMKDRDNGPAEATAIDPGNVGPFSIDPPEDEDWFLLEVPARSHVDLHLSGRDGDPDLRLLDRNLNQIAYSDDWQGTWSRIEADLGDGGVYYAVVADLGRDTAIHDYWLNYTLRPNLP